MDRRRRLGEGRTEGQEEHGRCGLRGHWEQRVERRRPLLGPATVCTEYTVWRPYPLSEESSACVLSERLVCARGSRREERPRDPCVSVSVPLAGHGPLSTIPIAHKPQRIRDGAW